jgi:ATP-dependent DNA helicase RecQ
MLVGEDEEENMNFLINAQFPAIKEIAAIYDELCVFLQVAIGDGRDCSFVFNIYEFCRRTKRSVNDVMHALNLLNLNGYLTLIDEAENPARIKFRLTRDELYSLHLTSEEDSILITLLRLYGGGIFSEFRPIDEMEIASMCRLDITRVHDFMKRLWRGQIIQYIPKNNEPLIHLNEERLPKRDIYIAPETYTLRRERMEERLASILYYATNSDECRSNIIERYFLGSESEPCGVCDNCLARKRKASQPATNIDEEILRLAKEGVGIRAMAEQIKCNQEHLIERIKELRESGKLQGWEA